MRVKRLYLFMLQTFLPVFCMTFFICLFIVLMQFLWRYVNDLVGKGLGLDVISELFFYAALTMVPMALPLAILLASLMTFGNLGEHFELTAMKAAGVSLLNSMKPLIALMVAVAIGAFFFQNDVLPVAQTKMWTLLFSMRQKSPELEIPKGVFYDQISGYNIFVADKNMQTGVLYDMMIYDLSRGFENQNIILADSGRLAFTEDKTHLHLMLWEGETFENLKDVGGAAASNLKNVPYRRESFTTKEVIIPFDFNFNRMEEDGIRSQYVGQNIEELRHSIDSIHAHIDSIGRSMGAALMERPVMQLPFYNNRLRDGKVVKERMREVMLPRVLNVDSILKRGTATWDMGYANDALNSIKREHQEVKFKAMTSKEQNLSMRRHGIEMHKKFTLSFACIIFFFIGAPLGAIIRKGGLGMPVVISVFLFIFYFIIDNIGFKNAREGRMEVWIGMWLSSMVLLPLGIFLTYKAVNDSAVMNPDAWFNFLRRLAGRPVARRVEVKELIMDTITPAEARRELAQMDSLVEQYLNANPTKQGYLQYWRQGYDMKGLASLDSEIEAAVERLTNYPERLFVLKLADIPPLAHLWLLRPGYNKAISWAGIIIFPIGLPLWLIGLGSQKRLRADLQRTRDIIAQLESMLPAETTENQ